MKRWLPPARAEDTASIKCRWIVPSAIEEIPAGGMVNEITQQPKKHCFLFSGQAYQQLGSPVPYISATYF